jgi:hypothetical protein
MLLTATQVKAFDVAVSLTRDSLAGLVFDICFGKRYGFCLPLGSCSRDHKRKNHNIHNLCPIHEDGVAYHILSRSLLADSHSLIEISSCFVYLTG